MLHLSPRPFRPTALPGLPGRLVAVHRMLAARLSVWRERACARRELRDVDDSILRDIGLSRAQANFEAGKPPWRG